MPDRTPLRPESPLTVVAARIGPAVSAQTWSLLPTGGRALFHGFLLLDGEAALSLAAGSELDLNAPALIWVPAGQGRELRIEAGAVGLAVSASESLVWRTVGESSLTVDLPTLLEQIVIAPAGSFPERDVLVCFEAMERELRQVEPGGLSVATFALGMVLIHLWRASSSHEQSNRAIPGGHDGLVHRYRQLVELHFRDRVSVQGFADLLGVTRSRLNDACVLVAGMPPKAILHARLIEEARRRLDESGLSVEQVAYSLGFRDPAYFNRFFTRHTGTNPGSFKKATRSSKQSQPGSFAAWP